jgi:hypothetical protein
MVKDVQRHLDRQELKYPRRPLSTPTCAAGLGARLKAMALAGPILLRNALILGSTYRMGGADATRPYAAPKNTPYLNSPVRRAFFGPAGAAVNTPSIVSSRCPLYRMRFPSKLK